MSRANQERLVQINAIIEEYRSQGYTLTLRQLYYQLVSRDVIPNLQAEYKKLGVLLTKGRMAGVVDWDAIEDRIRVPKLPYYNTSVEEALQDAERQYRLDRQDGQDCYIEVWCEKDALSQVLYRVTHKYHIRLMVNRGYSSTTAMHDAFKRYRHRAGQRLVLLYVGDHDPSGLDMLRDIRERLVEFGVAVEVVPVALTKEQIEEHDPPPNPAKVTDPRAGDYIAVHGAVSWEVDALPPQTLHKLIEDAVLERIDEDLYIEQLDKEVHDKGQLKRIAKHIDEMDALVQKHEQAALKRAKKSKKGKKKK